MNIFRSQLSKNKSDPAGIYLFNLKNGNTRTIYEVCSNLTIKTPEQRQWYRSGDFIVNFGQISLIFWCFLCWLCTSKYRLGNSSTIHPQTLDKSFLQEENSYVLIPILKILIKTLNRVLSEPFFHRRCYIKYLLWSRAFCPNRQLHVQS